VALKIGKWIVVDEKALAEICDFPCDGCLARETPSLDESEEIRAECPIVKHLPEYACQNVPLRESNAE